MVEAWFLRACYFQPRSKPGCAKFCFSAYNFQTKGEKYKLKDTEFHRDLYYLLILDQRYNQILIFLELYFFTKSFAKVTSADKKYTFQETKINLISYILCSLNKQFNFAFCKSIDCSEMYIKNNSDLKSLLKIVSRLSLQTYWVNFDCSKDFLLKSNWVWCVQNANPTKNFLLKTQQRVFAIPVNVLP